MSLNEDLDWGKRTGLSIVTKLALTIVAVCVVIVTVAVACGYFFFTKALETSYNEMAYNVADAAAAAVDPDNFDTYLATQTTDEQWQSVHDALQELNDSMDCTFIYVVRFNEDESAYTYIYEAVNPDMGFSEYPLGYEDPADDAAYKESFKEALAGKTPDRELLYVYPNGSKDADTAAYKPLYKSDGSIAGMLVVEMPMSRLASARSEFLSTLSLVSYGDMIVLLVIIIVVLNARLIKPVRRINKEAHRFVDEQAEPSRGLLNITNKDEIGMLARTLTKLEYATKEHIDNLATMTAEKERVGTELAVATHIQANTLPMTFPIYPKTLDYELYATMQPAKEVGGDFYDFFEIDDEHLGLVIADVAGKGVPAALYMMASKIEIKNLAMSGLSPAEVLTQANENLCANSNGMDMFVTVWIGIYDANTHVLTCSNAGHEYPALCRADGTWEILKDKHKLALGAFEGIAYEEYTLEMGVGDTLMVYTDGVAEATNSASELYGLERMITCLNTNPGAEPRALIDSLVEDVMAFTGEAEQFDDVTALAFRPKR